MLDDILEDVSNSFSAVVLSSARYNAENMGITSGII